MLIQEMTKEECGSALESISSGAIACARDSQPYVVPTYFSYDGKHIYGCSALGQKIEWMRSNPLVCLQIDERRNLFQWLSVVVSGRFEELPDTRDFESERLHAHALLQKRAMWWQPALVPTGHRDGLMPVFYRIHIVGITGRRAMPDKFEAAALVTE